MPDNFKHLQDIDIPFMVGMVARARAFVIDKAMMTLIVLLVTTSSSLGVAIYKLNEAEKAITTQSLHIQKLILALNTVQNDVDHMRGDLDRLTNSMAKHLDGHPIRIAR